MKIRIDADAFPDIQKVLELAKQEQIEVILYCDNTHHLDVSYGKVIVCDKGFQSVDMKLMNQIEPFDIVLTQDYGVATVALSKQAAILHPKGMIYTNENIDTILFERHLHAKLRKHSHVKGPKKRTVEDQKRLLENLYQLIQKGKQASKEI